MTDARLPPLYPVRQTLDAAEVSDLPGAVRQALDAADIAAAVRTGQRVAVTAGSRGIDRIAEVLRATVAWLRQRGAEPFVVAAMGSHGGGTAEGCLRVLTGLGITAEAVGAPVVSDPRTRRIGEAAGTPVHCTAAALEADGVVVVNRVKPHTSFTGRYESGLVKMLAVGLGGPEGAAAVHVRGVRALSAAVPEMARHVLGTVPVLFGLAIVENGHDRIARLEAIPVQRILTREPDLLEEARGRRPVLPFEEADVLVVETLGKDLSGTGMDTGVIGRLFIAGEADPVAPRIRRIAVLRLSPGAKGNAYGIGLADTTTEALLRSIDPVSTRANALASTFIERIRLPIALPSEREAILTAVSTCGQPMGAGLRIARIRDTLHLADLWVSEPLLSGLSPTVRVLGGPLEWRFDGRGALLDAPPRDPGREC